MALPDRPSLEYLKKLAKDRLPEFRRADASACLADALLAVAREHAFFSPDGRLKPNASRTGSSRYRPDGTRLPCPPGTDREIVSDALYMAARNGHEGAVRELLTRGPDLAFRAFAEGTALHWAHFAGAPAVVALLLGAGADPTVRDPVLGCTPEAFGICTAASWAWLSKVRHRLAENPWPGPRAVAGNRCTRRRGP